MTTDQSPWLKAQEQLAHFTLHRCVMMKHEDWRELSSVMSSINSLYTSSGSSGAPAFVYTLELLLKLGQVTSCLLSLNGDDPAFSVARVAQAIKTTTCVLDSCHNLSEGAGLPPEIADSLARQRCEQTPLLQAMAWALRQEARALFFNPRPTALSLATALLELFRAIERIWPDDIFAPPHAHEAAVAAAAARSAAGDPTAAHLADPAAQLAMAMMRCAGRAMGEVGAASSKQIMLGGLRVADDLMHQISSLMVRAESLGDQVHVKQLLQSPSILQLMLTLVAIQTQRLQQQVGMKDEDSFTYQHPVQHGIAVPEESGSSDDESLDANETSGRNAPESEGAGAYSCAVQQGKRRQPAQQQQLQRQQSKRQQDQQQHLESSDEDDHVHDGAGELHQLWNQVLGMAKQQAAVQQPAQPEQPSTPLLQFWKALGLPEALLALAATTDVFTRPADVEYVQACKVARFLLQGSAHLQPSREQGNPAASSAATAALDLAGHSAAGGEQQQRARLSRDLSPLSPRSPGSPSFPIPGQDEGGPQGREGAMSPAAATAALLVDSCRDYGLRGQEELEVLSLQRLLPVVLLDTAAALTSGHFDYPLAAAAAAAAAQGGASHAATAAAAPHGKKMNGSSSHSSLARLSVGSCSTPTQLEIVSAACAAAAYSARCWPVLQKVAAAQSEPPAFSLAGAPSGVFAGLSMVYWQQYELEQPEMHLPVQELLQLVVQVIQQLYGQPLAQQQQQQLQQLLSMSATLAMQQSVAAGRTRDANNPLQPELQPPTQLLNGTANGVAALQPEADIAASITLQHSGSGNVKQAGGSTPGASATAEDMHGVIGTAIIPSRPPLSPRSREALWGLLEVLTAVSKLPWEVEPQASANVGQQTHHKHRRHHSLDGHGSGTAGVKAAGGTGQNRAGRSFKQQQLDRLYTAEAWRATSQAVAAAVEAVLRSCSGTSAVVRAAPKSGGSCSHAGVLGSVPAGSRARHQMLHPATVALGSCLASMCAPLGRPGPLVAAVGLTEPCSGAQLQLFALLASKIKLMLTDTSGRKELIAMQPIEQTPVHILDQLSKRLKSAAACKTGDSTSSCSDSGSSSNRRSCGSAKHSTAAGAAAALEIAAAAVPWLLILARLIKLRGRLLGELLQRDREAATSGLNSGESSTTATLHNAFWHIQMATASALAVEKHVGLLAGVSSNEVGRMVAVHAQQAGLLSAAQAVCTVQHHPGQQAVQQSGVLAAQQPDHLTAAAAAAARHAGQHVEVLAAAAASPVGGFELQQVLQQLQSEVLPALKQAVQLCKAAMKLARHYHETGFASGFAAGFAAGYAAALAAGAGSAAAAGGRSISFVSPAGVLQQASIRDLPQLLKTFGGVLSGQLVLPLWCNNPLCLNMSEASELQLLAHGTGTGHRCTTGLHGVACAKCGAARYCSEGCRAQHKTRHKPLCKQLCKRLDSQGVQ